VPVSSGLPFPARDDVAGLARVAKAAEGLQCRYSEVKYWATTSIGWSLISRCLIRARQCGVLTTAAMDDLEGKHDVRADQRVDQFVRLRDAIEERASRKFFEGPVCAENLESQKGHCHDVAILQDKMRSTDRRYLGD
jgi:hypothetical protein